jgi:hypothetical protein
MTGFTYENKAGLEYITLPQWRREGVSMGFSTRWGGVSPAPYNSLNLALHVGDNYNNVIENRSRYLDLFALKLENMVCCEQVHGNTVAVVGKEEQGRGAAEKSGGLAGVDAMVCTTPGIMLTAFYADCIPVYLFDPLQRVVAIAHSGWKGTMGRIGGETLKTMARQFGSSPHQVQAFIGPGIGGCCFNIGEELVHRVQEEFVELDGILKYNCKGYTWDLPLTNRLILQEMGVKPDNIIDCDLCTACHRERFFSYRRDQGKTGRMAAVIALDY